MNIETVPGQTLPHEDGFVFRPRDSAEFAAESHHHTYLVDQVLVAGQPAVIGGPKKSLKTTLAMDLALSIGSGTSFLDHFHVRQKTRVMILSGESGVGTLQETARRICTAKGISLATCDVHWQTNDLPRLSDPADRGRLCDGLQQIGAKVVIIDPLYLCLMGGSERADATNLYETGPLLLRAARACLDAGATPVFVHHATKAALKKAEAGEPLDLDDLAFAGIGEFVRQWILVGSRVPFTPGSGRHALSMALGGSAGHSSAWHLDINVGNIRLDGTGRIWNVAVSPFAAENSTAPTKKPARRHM